MAEHGHDVSREFLHFVNIEHVRMQCSVVVDDIARRKMKTHSEKNDHDTTNEIPSQSLVLVTEHHSHDLLRSFLRLGDAVTSEVHGS
jgi:hypothetical protein